MATQAELDAPQLPKLIQWTLVAVQQVGAPLVLSAVLLYFVLHAQTERADAQSAAIHSVKAAVDAHAEDSRRLVDLLFASCLNAADTAIELDRCRGIGLR